MPQDHEAPKPRSPKAEKEYNEADNAGRFAGNDEDSRQAQQDSLEKVRQEKRESGTAGPDIDLSENNDLLARRDEQSHNYKGEADNVNDDTGRSLDEQELNHARNKAREGKREE